MIEFNEKAKEDNPIASLLGVNGLKLFVDTILITKTPNPVIIAKQKPSKSSLAIIGAMGDLGFIEHYPDYLPEDIIEWRNGTCCLYSTRNYDSWHSLRNWKSLAIYANQSDVTALDTLFKIVVCNYVATLDKEGKIVLKHPMNIPLGVSFTDEDELIPTPASPTWSQPQLAEGTTTDESIQEA